MKINKAKRREWLQASRQFKRHIKVLAKLGVLQVVCEQVAAQRRIGGRWDRPQWENEKWVEFLYNCVKNNEYPPELLEGFAKTAEITFMASSPQPTVEKTLEAVDYVFRRLSKRLREKFGVFVEGGQ